MEEDVAAFGGDPKQVHLGRLSGGRHVIHQFIHHTARLAPREVFFITTHLQSNAILAQPLTPVTRNGQHAAFCQAPGVGSNMSLNEPRDTLKCSIKTIYRQPPQQNPFQATSFMAISLMATHSSLKFFIHLIILVFWDLSNVGKTLVINATGLDSQSLIDVEDKDVHSVRGQTVLVKALGYKSCIMHAGNLNVSNPKLERIDVEHLARIICLI
ncbi:hypothetical protein L204_102230 [Cryptococcus depauperatus]|nr:hypothetical protein L204_04728 [Cryptococcus depauperatus CBS 7855]